MMIMMNVNIHQIIIIKKTTIDYSFSFIKDNMKGEREI